MFNKQSAYLRLIVEGFWKQKLQLFCFEFESRARLTRVI